MAFIRIGISAALGVLVTFALIILMYKLIDSGNKDLDEKEAFKIPDFLHVDRQLTENSKNTEVEKPEDPELIDFTVSCATVRRVTSIGELQHC